MPRPTPPKLHGKGKPVALQKSHKVDKDIDEIVDNDSTKNFRLELIWCIQQLERVLIEKKGNEKQLQETWKVLAVLKNNNQPIIRKRQLMRTHLGDYRAKMLEEEKKLIKMASKIKISESSVKPKAIFLRKATSLTTGGSSFIFNFDSNSEQTEKSNAENTNDSSFTRNFECANDETPTNGEVLTSKDPVADITGTLSNKREGIVTAIAETTAIEEPEVGVSVAADTQEPVIISATSESSENPKNFKKSFKFIPSKTPFMFNFSHTNEDKN